MADLKISELTAATTPLNGAEVVPVLQGGANRRATAAQIGAAALAAHEAAADPHPQYLTQTEGDGRYVQPDDVLPVYLKVKNTSGVQITKGTPVYVTGSVGDTDVLQIAAADSANPSKVPTVGLVTTTLAQNGEGLVIMFGDLLGVNTGSYQLGQELYVAAGGGLTSTKPASGYVQSVAVVSRVNSNTGSLLVWTNGEMPTAAGTNLAYDAATRVLSSSTGNDATLPEATTTAAGLMASADKTKLDGIAAGAEVNVNADWNASSGDAQILNKPSIPAPADATPQPPGTAAIGTRTDYAREDHVHALPPLVSTSTAGLRPALAFDTITYGSTVALDLAALNGAYKTISLTGNLEFTTSNLANGRAVVIRLVADGTQRNLTFPTDWKFLGTKPANIAASKVGVLSLTVFGTTNADVIAAWGVQS